MLKTNIKKLPGSEVEIEGELEADVFEKYFSVAVKKIGENLEIDGFRKGKVPESVLLSKVPESRILNEMAELALSEYYPKILEENKIDAIGRPEITITKLARKNPLGFKIKTAALPEVKLPDYKEIAKKIIAGITDAEKNFEATEKEIEDTILDIRKSRAPKIHMADAVKSDGEKTEATLPSEDKISAEKGENKPAEPELPELSDDFVRSLGPFKDIADFRDRLKENIKLEKQNNLKEKTRLKIVEKIIEEMRVDLPGVLVHAELDKILYRMESDITAMGMNFEDYLKHIKKTPEDLRKEFRPDAEKKAKLELAIHGIAEAENISADPERVAQEVSAILEHYKDADPERARMHAENVLTNEKVFEFLEGQG